MSQLNVRRRGSNMCTYIMGYKVTISRNQWQEALGQKASFSTKILNVNHNCTPVGLYFKFTCIYSVYQKKLYPLKFKLSASYCFNWTALTASN